jgi:radical SAM enzyme (TIGR01210 family)
MGILKSLLSDFSYTDHIFDPIKKKMICRWVLMLPGAGCSWTKEDHGGCYMCGFKNETRKYTRNILFPTFAFTKLFDMCYKYQKHNKPYLASIFNGGSFTNDREVPQKAQIEICKRIKKIGSIEQLLIEARTEYVTTEKIRMLMSHLGGKELIVGIGLECLSDEVRKKGINKGFDIKDYEKALRIIKDCGAKTLTYGFIKPMYLSEKAAIKEAVDTASYAFSKGSEYVVFNAATVAKDTKMCEVYEKSGFNPPWLWSILEVAKSTHHMGAMRIGDFTDEPKPIAGPTNCVKCTEPIKKLFKEYKRSYDLSVFDGFSCDCQKEWEHLIRSDN